MCLFVRVQVWNHPEAECGDGGSVPGFEWEESVLHVLWSHAGTDDYNIYDVYTTKKNKYIYPA